MANARMAAGGVLGVITDVANTISTTSNTISNGVGILNDMVLNIKNRRMESDLVNSISYRDNLINDASLDAVKREEAIQAYIGNDEAKKKSFTEFSAKLEKAFETFDKQD